MIKSDLTDKLGMALQDQVIGRHCVPKMDIPTGGTRRSQPPIIWIPRPQRHLCLMKQHLRDPILTQAPKHDSRSHADAQALAIGPEAHPAGISFDWKCFQFCPRDQTEEADPVRWVSERKQALVRAEIK